MSVQGLSARAPAATVPAASAAEKFRDIVQSTVFYGIVAVGFGAPVVLSVAGMVLR